MNIQQLNDKLTQLADAFEAIDNVSYFTDPVAGQLLSDLYTLQERVQREASRSNPFETPVDMALANSFFETLDGIQNVMVEGEMIHPEWLDIYPILNEVQTLLLTGPAALLFPGDIPMELLQQVTGLAWEVRPANDYIELYSGNRRNLTYTGRGPLTTCARMEPFPQEELELARNLGSGAAFPALSYHEEHGIYEKLATIINQALTGMIPTILNRGLPNFVTATGNRLVLNPIIAHSLCDPDFDGTWGDVLTRLERENVREQITETLRQEGLGMRAAYSEAIVTTSAAGGDIHQLPALAEEMRLNLQR